MKDNRPLFSIATPCWNSVSTIERTIKSILAQEFTDYEYIIVDGGSTDGTVDIIKKYEPLFEGRMKWKSAPDKGLYDAFNKGVERSNGVYCWNVNADDYIEPDALKNLAEFIHSNKWAELPVIAGKLNFVSQNSQNIISIISSDTNNIEKCFKRDFIGVPHPATLVPKIVYDMYGVFDSYYKICGDADWFRRVYLARVPFVFVDFIISNMSDGGVSNQYDFFKSLQDRIYYFKKHYSNPLERFIRLSRWTLSFYYNKLNHKLTKIL